MREILFRGKRVDNGEWLYGLYDDEEHGADFPAIIPNRSDQKKYVDWAVDPATVGQYTGLTDKNGKKIFEGDLIKNECEQIKKVVYTAEDITAGFYVTPAPCNELWAVLRGTIVGNIYDNPELLQN